jgi:hypothetical protein
MRGHHAIPARLDDGDLYIGLRGGRFFLVRSETGAVVLMKVV